MIEQWIGSCVWVRSKVTSSGKSTVTLQIGLPYEHAIIASNDSLWPLDVDALSTVYDVSEIAYKNPPPGSWSVKLTLDPNDERTAIGNLTCVKKSTGINGIKTAISLSNSHSDRLNLKLMVK
jgi:hypothetical protein